MKTFKRILADVLFAVLAVMIAINAYAIGSGKLRVQISKPDGLYWDGGCIVSARAIRVDEAIADYSDLKEDGWTFDKLVYLDF